MIKLVIFLLLCKPPISDVDILCRLVEAEAGVCDVQEKILVAQCVVNRMESEEFPNSIVKVIEDPGAFQVVTNNRINEVEVTRETRAAVRFVLQGRSKSTVLFFGNYELCSPSMQAWYDTLSEIYRGKMRYYE